MQIDKVQSSTGGNFLKVGIAEFKVLAINPNLRELNKLLEREEKEDQKEPEYITEKDGIDHVKITFWLQDVVSGWKTPLTFDIGNESASTYTNKKPIWVNASGDSAKVDEENIQKWFKEVYKSKDDKTVIGEREYRRALLGEDKLYEFMKSWMSRTTTSGMKINWWGTKTNILLDTKKLLRGNMAELKELLTAPEEENITGTVVLAAWVDSYEKDGELKYAQKIWQYRSAPGCLMKKFNLAIQQNNWEADKDSKKFAGDLTGQYGISGAFTLGKLQEFKPEGHLPSTNAVIKMSDDDVTDTSY